LLAIDPEFHKVADGDALLATGAEACELSVVNDVTGLEAVDDGQRDRGRKAVRHGAKTLGVASTAVLV
jgi:hypothetical protein